MAILISLEEFKDMQTRFDAYVKEYNRDPDKIYFSDGKDFIWTNDLLIISRLKESEFPINYSNTNESNPNIPPAIVTDFSKLKDKFGDFDTICQFYDKVLRSNQCDYDYYYNQKFSVKETLNSLLNESVTKRNCTDWSVLLCWVAQHLGYPFRVYNVVCKSNTGHVRIGLIDKNNPGDWLSTDPAAISAKTDRYYDCVCDVWCDTRNGGKIVDTSDKNKLLGWMHW